MIQAILLLLTIWHIAPRGTPTGDGTLSKPWDLETGIVAVKTKPAGDTLQVDSVSYLKNWKIDYPRDTVKITVTVTLPPVRDTLRIVQIVIQHDTVRINLSAIDSAEIANWWYNYGYGRGVTSVVCPPPAHDTVYVNLPPQIITRYDTVWTTIIKRDTVWVTSTAHDTVRITGVSFEPGAVYDYVTINARSPWTYPPNFILWKMDYVSPTGYFTAKGWKRR